MESNKRLNKKKFWAIYLCCCFIGFSWILLAGCSQKNEGAVTASITIPRTPEEAGIAVLDSSNCESCHLSPEMISTFEKPKTGEPIQSEGG